MATALHSLAATRETPDIETSSEVYAWRFNGPAGGYLLAMQARAVRAAMPPIASPSVLEVGGGHGQLVPLFAELGCRTTVIGSDASCSDRLRRLGWSDSVQLVTGDLLDLPYTDRAFDVVVSVRLLAHMKDWPRLLSECCRVARHSIVFDYPSKRSVNTLMPLLFGVKRMLEPDVRTFTSFSREELLEVLARAGYGIEAEHKQFLLPVALHRKTGARLKGLEAIARWSALTRCFGSPVVLRADRSKPMR